MGNFLGADVGTGAAQFSRLHIPGRNAESEHDAAVVSEQEHTAWSRGRNHRSRVGYCLVLR